MKKKVSQKIILIMMVFVLSVSANTQKILVNTDDVIALSGYDPVTFFTERKPVPGKPEIKSVNKGAVYLFSSPANKIKFDNAPENYLPQNGGFCTVSASMGKVAKIEIETWSIVENKLYLQKNQSAKRMWDKDPPNYIKKSSKKWPGLVEKYGKILK